MSEVVGLEVAKYIMQLKGQLAECYRLSGADPDGNEDWRLAPSAVAEVKRLREDYDALLDSNEKLAVALAFARSVIMCGEPWTDACEEIIGGALRSIP